MRINRVTAQAFGAFAEKIEVDFAAGAANGVLLIRGKTGSGKTTILDAVSYGLFGSVARYDRTGKDSEKVRSTHAAVDLPTVVTVDFLVGGCRYLVERQAKWQRPKKHGSGITTQNATAKLFQWDSLQNRWNETHSRAADVGHALAEIIPLTAKQFYQVVLLAQGAFQRFLQASQEERKDTLRTLFGSAEYEHLTEHLVTQSRAVRGQLAAAKQQLEIRLTDLHTAVAQSAAELGAALDRIGLDATLAESELGAVLTAGSSAADDADIQQEFASEIAKLAAKLTALETATLELRKQESAQAQKVEQQRLELQHQEQLAHNLSMKKQLQQEAMQLAAQQEKITALQQEVSLARRAQLVRPVWQATKQAASENTTAAEQAAQAEAAYKVEIRAVSSYLPDIAAEPHEQVQAQLITELKAAAEAETVAAVLAATEQKLHKAAGHEKTLIAKLNEQSEQLAAIPAQLSAAREQVSATEQAAAKLQGAKLRLENATLKLQQVKDASEQKQQLREAAALLETAQQRATESELIRSKLVAQRFAGIAVELAQTLTPGEQCQVCGSREHPNPAQHNAEAVVVTEMQIRKAEAEAASAREKLANAVSEHSKLQQGLESLEQQLQGLDIETAAAELEEAEAVVRSLTATVATQATVAAELTKLQAIESQLHKDVKQLHADSAQASKELALLQQEQNQLAAELAQIIGQWESAATKIEMLKKLEQTLHKMINAQQAVANAEAQFANTQRALQQALNEHGFTTEAEFETALHEESWLAQATEQIAAHEKRLAIVEAELAKPEYNQLSDADPLPNLTVIKERFATETAKLKALTRAAEVHSDRVRIQQQKLLQIESDVATLQGENEAALTLIELADTLSGNAPNKYRMPLETFYLAAKLEEVVQAANARLEQLVDGRYRLEHSDEKTGRENKAGLGVAVYDNFAGRLRSTDSLSGGESFLVALSLALGLADTVSAAAGGVQLDSLFIDEGFGTLDAESLQDAIALLNELRLSGRLVTVISHVPQLHEQFSSQVHVHTDGRGSSRVEQKWQQQ